MSTHCRSDSGLDSGEGVAVEEILIRSQSRLI